MNDMQPQLQMMFGGGRKRRVLDRLTVPPQHVRKLYELHDAISAKREEGKGGVIAAQRELWGFVAQILPFTKGRDVSINTSNVIFPTIDVYGTANVIPQVGKNGVIATFEIPEEHLYRFIELCEAEGSGAVAKYDLWSFVASLTNLRHEDDRGRKIINTVTLANEWSGVISKLEDEEE